VRLRGDSQQLPSGSNNASGEKRVNSQTVKALERPETPTEGGPNDSGRRDRREGEMDVSCVCCICGLADQGAGADGCGARCGIDGDGGKGAGVDYYARTGERVYPHVATASDLEGDRVHGGPCNLESVSYMSNTQRRKWSTEATTSCSVATLINAPAEMGLISLQPEDRALKPSSEASLIEAPELRTWRRDRSFWEELEPLPPKGETGPEGQGKKELGRPLCDIRKVFVGFGV
jgi:hypothetical protein